MTGDTPLELRDVTSGYSDVAVIRRASVSILRSGSSTVVGSNGAGKEIDRDQGCGGIAACLAGRVLVRRIEITNEAADRRVYRGIAYVPQGRIVVPEMTVQDNLMISAHVWVATGWLSRRQPSRCCNCFRP